MKHRTLDLDIGICPLIEDEFNRNKTPIKWIEFGITEVPLFAPYLVWPSVVQDGEDV